MPGFTVTEMTPIILQMVGKTGDATYTQRVQTFYNQYSFYAAVPMLRYMVVLRETLRLLIGEHLLDYNTKTGDIYENEREKFQNILELLKFLNADIALVKKEQFNLQSVAVGTLKRYFPREYSGYLLGPNAAWWRGTPSGISDDVERGAQEEGLL